MEQREFFFFEWVVIDNCNLNCSYCVNKGVFSQKPHEEMEYVGGREVRIAEKIVEFSKSAKQVFVNFTGGEPLLAKNFIQALHVLTKAPNITIRLISNLTLLDKMQTTIEPYLPSLRIFGSLHVAYRNDKEVEKLISFINRFRSKLNMVLTQVDYNLTADDMKKLSRISKETKLEITYQTFMPTQEESQMKKEESKIISNKHFISTLGKRCCLGYSHFFIKPDGKFYYDLWCSERTRKVGDFLSLTQKTLDKFILDDMRKCPQTSCGCNYNIFNYNEYLNACKRLGYPKEEVCSRKNTRLSQRILRKLTSCKTVFSLKKNR